jgi:hypothetical protein
MNFLKPVEVQSYVKRLKFFELNQYKISSNDKPTRGFLHMMEPRIHWLIDLLLIDNNQFCKNAIIKPANFLLKYFDNPNFQYEDLMTNYYAYLLTLESSNNSIISSDNYEDDNNSITLAINELKNYYPKLIPLNTTIDLIQIISSIQEDIFVPASKILENLTKTYTILRDWNPKEGFIDISSIKN